MAAIHIDSRYICASVDKKVTEPEVDPCQRALGMSLSRLTPPALNAWTFSGRTLSFCDEVHDYRCDRGCVDHTFDHKHALDNSSLAPSELVDLATGEPGKAVVEYSREDKHGKKWKDRKSHHQVEPVLAPGASTVRDAVILDGLYGSSTLGHDMPKSGVGAVATIALVPWSQAGLMSSKLTSVDSSRCAQRVFSVSCRGRGSNKTSSGPNRLSGGSWR